MELDIYQVDAFAQRPFEGNPAGVCIVESALSEQMMQKIAAEMAVSETAFYCSKTQELRWFTPEIEVALCGHGTLAVAHVLQQLGQAEESIVFETKSGPLSVAFSASQIEMDFPLPRLNKEENENRFLKPLGIAKDEVVCSYSFDNKLMIVVKKDVIVQKLTPDYSALKSLQGRGILVTALSSDSNLDVISRYFAPWVGVNEDPVTGSAHCALAQYWCAELEQSKLQCFQASERGGRLTVTKLNSQRVLLSGQAVTTLKGKMYL
ncbi:PhzF family phenazine biosynthesis protein [Vibrio sonorensis]|uniref:PhzF family phenazine biosynthesis protein n=1 Tax=Vibrio sonorensis TaxID=1004316 RepID=UPI0008DB33AC|nr:PhzF family phenazine biosynthesis protein [Vibrio sonorensis]